MLAERANILGKSVSLQEYSSTAMAAAGQLLVIPQPLANDAVCGQIDPANAQSLLDGLDRAVDGCLSGEFSALVTAPLQKSVINDAGISFTGHTEYLAERTNSGTPVMLLAADELRVALATTHMPLREVPERVDNERHCRGS